MKKNKQEVFHLAVPEKLNVPPDPLVLRLDFHSQSVAMHTYNGHLNSVRLVSAMDVAHALAKELSFSSGILPENTLWWANTAEGPVYALWEEPHICLVALQEEALKPPRRFTIPLPGLIFLCLPGKAPWVYAARQRPSSPEDIVYRAPLCNIFQNGRSCPGNHQYPADAGKMVESFFMAFFTASADLTNRSVKYPKSIVGLWEHLDKKAIFPLKDMVKHGTVKDLMEMRFDR